VGSPYQDRSRQYVPANISWNHTEKTEIFTVCHIVSQQHIKTCRQQTVHTCHRPEEKERKTGRKAQKRESTTHAKNMNSPLQSSSRGEGEGMIVRNLKRMKTEHMQKQNK
jgi:hypothetical protein